MARESNISKEHAFKRIQNEIEKDQVPSPLFFYGREQYLIHWATEAIVSQQVESSLRALDFNKLDTSSLTLEGLVNQCETLPMGSSKRVVLIEDFVIAGGKSVKGFSEGDEEELNEYLKVLPETTTLIITADTADKRRKFFKTVQTFGGCYEFGQLNENLLHNFIEKRLKQGGKSSKPGVIDRMIGLSGYYDKESDYTLYHLENDIKKAIAHSTGSEIVLADISNAVSGNSESFVFDLMDALSEGRKGDAFVLLHDLLRSGESEYKLLALICSQLETILMTKELISENRGFEEVKQILGIHEFRIRKAIRHAEGRSIEQLKKTLKEAYEVDKTIKSGLMDAKLALEMLIAGA